MVTAAERDCYLTWGNAAWTGAFSIGLLIGLVLGKYIRFALAKCTCRLSRLHEDIGSSSFARGNAVLKGERANSFQVNPVAKRQPEFPFQIFGECHHTTLDTRTGSRVARIPLGFSTRRGIRRDSDWQAFYRRSALTQRRSVRW